MTRYQICTALVALALAGCAQEAATTSNDASPGSETSTAAPVADSSMAGGAGENSPGEEDSASAEEVSLKILSWAETEKLAKSHAGKVVVLDLWSTACLPCVQEFPHLVELHRKYGADKVVCMSASCDYEGIKGETPESHHADVLAFLKKQGATFDNILLSDESDAVYQQIDLASIPAVYVFGPDGALVKRFDNDSGEYLQDGAESFSYEKHINPVVAKLIESGSLQPALQSDAE